MAKSTEEIKQEMALPPIPQPAPRGRSHRNRNRLRLEISKDQCDSFVSMLGNRLKELTVDDEEFRSLYAIYCSLKAQLGKSTNNKGAVLGEFDK